MIKHVDHLFGLYRIDLLPSESLIPLSQLKHALNRGHLSFLVLVFHDLFVLFLLFLGTLDLLLTKLLP